jgi:hypothetical protein
LIGLVFPPAYKSHLLKYNGGRCEPNVFDFMENGALTQSMVDWFFAIYDGEYDNLLENLQIFKIDHKRLPTQMLPIAHDPGGNLICISCFGSDSGKVYFWDHEKEVDYSIASDDDYSNLYLIANSFEEFLDGLYEDSSDEKE